MIVVYYQDKSKAGDAILLPVCVILTVGQSNTRVVQSTTDCADAFYSAPIEERTCAAELHLLLVWLSSQGHYSATT